MEKDFHGLLGRGELFGPAADTAREGEAEAPAWADLAWLIVTVGCDRTVTRADRGNKTPPPGRPLKP